MTIGGFVLGFLLLLAFVLFELRRRDPMLDPRLFARRGLGVGSLSLTLQFFAQFGFLFVSLQYLQFVLGYSPLEAGLALVPMALMLMAISPQARKLARRLGVRAVAASAQSTTPSLQPGGQRWLRSACPSRSRGARANVLRTLR